MLSMVIFWFIVDLVPLATVTAGIWWLGAAAQPEPERERGTLLQGEDGKWWYVSLKSEEIKQN